MTCKSHENVQLSPSQSSSPRAPAIKVEKTLPNEPPRNKPGCPDVSAPSVIGQSRSLWCLLKGCPPSSPRIGPSRLASFALGQPRFLPPRSSVIRRDAIRTLNWATMWLKHAALTGSNPLLSYELSTLRLNHLRRPLSVAGSGALFTTTATCQKIQYPPRPKPPPDEEITEVYLKGSGPGGQKIVRFPIH